MEMVIWLEILLHSKIKYEIEDYRRVNTAELTTAAEFVKFLISVMHEIGVKKSKPKLFCVC